MENKRKDRFVSKEGELEIIYPEKKKSKTTGKPAKPHRAKASGTHQGKRCCRGNHNAHADILAARISRMAYIAQSIEGCTAGRMLRSEDMIPDGGWLGHDI